MSDDEGQKKKTGLFSKHLQETLQVFRLEGCSTVDGKLDKEAFMRCLARTELGKNATKETLEMLFDVFDADNRYIVEAAAGKDEKKMSVSVFTALAC